ncbi:MAG: tetratricopeptide repeat protein [Burkholderiales bacterium]
MYTEKTVLAGCRSLIIVVVMALSGCAVMDPNGEINALMTEGQQFYSAQRYDEAIARFRAATARDSGFYPAYVWLAKSLMAKGAWPDAVVNARKAMELSHGAPDVLPVLLDALYGGGTEALARGAFIDSIGYFAEYVGLQPGNFRAWINVAKAYAGNRQFVEALGALRRALETAPGGAERTETFQSLLGAGKQAFDARDYVSAINLLREYLKFNASDWSAYLTLGKALWESGAMRDALSTFARVLELNPRSTEALNLLQGR